MTVRRPYYPFDIPLTASVTCSHSNRFGNRQRHHPMLLEPDRTLAMGDYRPPRIAAATVPATESRNFHRLLRKRRVDRRRLCVDGWTKGAATCAKFRGSKVVMGKRDRWVGSELELSAGILNRNLQVDPHVHSDCRVSRSGTRCRPHLEFRFTDTVIHLAVFRYRYNCTYDYRSHPHPWKLSC
jgi:hypothetical protein